MAWKMDGRNKEGTVKFLAIRQKKIGSGNQREFMDGTLYQY